MSEARGRKSIFITGAASGIGAETARFFAKKGWFVGLYDIDERGLEDISDEIGKQNSLSGVLDVRDRDAWNTAMRDFGEATERQMNVLFNNAGIGSFGWMETIAPEESDRMIDVNLKGVVNGVYASLPYLKETRGARIINTASTAGIAGSPQLAVYSATKFAVRGLTEALDHEFSDFDVKVCCLLPWFVDTPILDSAGQQGTNRFMKDELLASGLNVYPVSMAAEKVWEAAHGKQMHYLVGKDAERARFAKRFFPGMLQKRIARSMPKRES